MLKKNFIIRILLLVMLCLSVIVIVPISYARYISVNNGNGSLDVAKWNIVLNNKNLDEVIKLDLFETIDDSYLKDGEKIIAPGVSGNIVLNIKNNSDVVAEGTIILEELSNNYNIPIVYSLEEDGNYVDINDFEIMSSEIINVNEEKKVTIYWKWDFYSSESQNNADIELGSSGTALFEISLDVRINQKVS